MLRFVLVPAFAVSFAICGFSPLLAVETSVGNGIARLQHFPVKGWNDSCYRFSAWPEGRGFEKLVKVAVRDGCLEVDAHAAFDAGAMTVSVHGLEDFRVVDIAGTDCQFDCTCAGPSGSRIRPRPEGFVEDGGYWTHDHYAHVVWPKSDLKTYFISCQPPPTLKRVSMRYVIERPGAEGPVRIQGSRIGRYADFPDTTVPRRKPVLLFHATFDHGFAADVARGKGEPMVSSGLEFAPGRNGGRAISVMSSSKSLLSYASSGNINPQRGTAAFWVKCKWPSMANGRFHDYSYTDRRRTLFALPTVSGAKGSGRIEAHWESTGLVFFTDDLDGRDARLYERWWRGGDWRHIVFAWNESRLLICEDGYAPACAELSPQHTALAQTPFPFRLQPDGKGYGDLFVGMASDGSQVADLLIDDVKIWSEPMSREELHALYEEERGGKVEVSEAYATEGVPKRVCVSGVGRDGRAGFFDRTGKCVKRISAEGEDVALPPGEYTVSPVDVEGVRLPGAASFSVFPAGGNRHERAGKELDLQLEKIDEVALGATNLPPSRFRSVGGLRRGTLKGVDYLEAGPNFHDRFAVRFNLGTEGDLFLFEVDYPDDRERLIDLLVQPVADASNPYEQECGVATGGDYPTGNETRTMRLLYWARSASDPAAMRRLRDVALIAMTGRHSGPAALSAVRLYRVKGGLPVARKPSGERHFFLYYEDPAVIYDFRQASHTFENFVEMLDRMVAYMKYSGQDALAYPGSWYHGLMDDDYRPRPHRNRYLQGFAERFDREGLSLMPTINLQTIWLPEGGITRRSMGDGSLHASPLSIESNGLVAWANWHEFPPNFNISHPFVRQAVLDDAAALADELKDHPSFLGICLHLTSITCPWWGSLDCGYNDYTIEAFEKATGVRIPCDRKDPMRGRAYADWLRRNALDRWIAWRCDVVTELYREIAGILQSRRLGLKLWVNAEPTMIYKSPGRIMDSEIVGRLLLEAGIDADKLTAAIPNLMLGVTTEPQGSRHSAYRRPGSTETRRRIGELPWSEDSYRWMRRAGAPCVNFHDSYFEDAIGGSGRPTERLSGDWLSECRWRVACLNGPGREALREFAVALGCCDVRHFAKGGFLVGTYGTEDVLTPWMDRFHSLPAKRFSDAGKRNGVVLRTAVVDGRHWAYLVNTQGRQAPVEVMVDGQHRRLVLDAYDLRIFSKSRVSFCEDGDLLAQ